MAKLTLSYSTINNCLQPTNSHNWINKQMGLKPEERPEWKLGTEGHRIIQQHLCGKVLHPALSNIKYTFPIVEEEDFDPRTKIVIKISESIEVIGFIDAIDPDGKRIGEIKLSSTPWMPKKYIDSYQRRIYALAFPEFTEAILFTGYKEPERWDKSPLKVYPIPLSDQDRKEAEAYIMDAVKLIEAGDFSGGLDSDGVCRNRYCYYGCNCSFKE